MSDKYTKKELNAIKYMVDQLNDLSFEMAIVGIIMQNMNFIKKVPGCGRTLSGAADIAKTWVDGINKEAGFNAKKREGKAKNE